MTDVTFCCLSDESADLEDIDERPLFFAAETTQRLGDDLNPLTFPELNGSKDDTVVAYRWCIEFPVN